MPIADTDLVAYASLNMPEDDTSTSGGGIDLNHRVTFEDIVTNSKIEIVSTSPSDTMSCTVTGRLADGQIVSETLNLTGTTVRVFNANTFERIMKVTTVSDVVGTVTVRVNPNGMVLATIPPGERGFKRMFYNAASDPTSTRTRYEKFFWRNNNGSIALTNAVVSQFEDPQGVIAHALATTKGDNGSVVNRLSAPGGLTFNDTDKNVPTGTLAAGEAIGVWLRQTLAAGTPGFNSYYTTRISGSSI